MERGIIIPNFTFANVMKRTSRRRYAHKRGRFIGWEIFQAKLLRTQPWNNRKNLSCACVKGIEPAVIDHSFGMLYFSNLGGNAKHDLRPIVYGDEGFFIF